MPVKSMLLMQKVWLLWEEKYDPNAEQKGLIAAKENISVSTKRSMVILEDVPTIIAEKWRDRWAGRGSEHRQQASMKKMLITVRTLFLVQITLVVMFDRADSATGSSLKIGLVAGIIATVIGLFLGLLAGYLGGLWTTWFCSLPTCSPLSHHPSFSWSHLLQRRWVSEGNHDGTPDRNYRMAVDNTFRTFPVISLRNRDHVNFPNCPATACCGLSLPTSFRTLHPTLLWFSFSRFPPEFWQRHSFLWSDLTGNHKDCNTWSYDAMGNQYNAHLNGAWWAYFPVILVIALISFS